MKPALEKFLLIAATLAAIGIFIYVALWTSIKDKKTQMDNLFNSTNVPTSYHFMIPPSSSSSPSLTTEPKLGPSDRTMDREGKLGDSSKCLLDSAAGSGQVKDTAFI
ncbi:hypothetical protein ACHHV8_01910 [Paenibacillus sp. TAB 01]|uniref:hypothetical protein n=1 Tax=Paenibacillus sp. TAB 01 TaxID=3368988 RepID=UPI003751650A